MEQIVIKSKKHFFEMAQNHRVKRIMIGGISLDDWDAKVKETIAHAQRLNVQKADIELNDSGLFIQGRKLLKPVFPREVTGELVIHAAKTSFVSKNHPVSWADKPDFKLINNGLELTTFDNSVIRYELLH
ncbi:hypothetical protein A1QO_04165 [Vibrio genomosp. F10 str. ZF-129]|uniref:Uncharacterized protein n=1 Tax=Vibrio genomosp. F10 str. ZF-129 TaxID=1187848 RepID=A0A1E5BJS4_9VIBR|nr:hypothetical protein [Vibrio genomosp. F10]OEE37307.1 hypothetical protein A1QO_04165 [Vibrio genomosp. F10 str. ZF-129]